MRSAYITSLLAGLLASMLVVHPAHPQQVPPKQSGPVPADSAIVRIITVAAVRELHYDLAAVALGQPPRAWEIIVPDSLAPTWQRARDGLYSLLRARRPTAQDTLIRGLSIRDVRVQGDSLFAYIETSARWRCGERWHGGETGYEVRVWRAGGHWQAPKTEAVLFGDGMSCQYLERRLKQGTPRVTRPTTR